MKKWFVNAWVWAKRPKTRKLFYKAAAIVGGLLVARGIADKSTVETILSVIALLAPAVAHQNVSDQ